MKKGLRPGLPCREDPKTESLVRIAALMKKGLRRSGKPGREGQGHSVRIAALMKKGLRQAWPAEMILRKNSLVRIAALMKKGLRRRPALPRRPSNRILVRIAALMKKGLRHAKPFHKLSFPFSRPNCCPDEEGIKTRLGLP